MHTFDTVGEFISRPSDRSYSDFEHLKCLTIEYSIKESEKKRGR